MMPRRRRASGELLWRVALHSARTHLWHGKKGKAAHPTPEGGMGVRVVRAADISACAHFAPNYSAEARYNCRIRPFKDSTPERAFPESLSLTTRIRLASS